MHVLLSKQGMFNACLIFRISILEESLLFGCCSLECVNTKIWRFFVSTEYQPANLMNYRMHSHGLNAIQS